VAAARGGVPSTAAGRKMRLVVLACCCCSSWAASAASSRGPRAAAGTLANDDFDLNYLCKNWSAPWPTCVPPAAPYSKNPLMNAFPISAWWDPTPDEWAAYKAAGFNWLQGVKMGGYAAAAPINSSEAGWALYAALVKRASEMGLMVGTPTGADINWGAEERLNESNVSGTVLRLPGKCVTSAKRDTNGPVTQTVQTATGCYLDPVRFQRAL